jgi:alkylhydroperoxidase/carboxymuconolactone decarboxylase family protein YurZ
MTDAVGGPTPESAAQYYERVLDTVPPPIQALQSAAPEFLEGYIAARKAVLVDREGGLDLATKELVFVLLDVIYDNEPGAMNHLEAALAAGMKPAALLDALLLTLLVGGIQTWGKAGHRVYTQALERKAKMDQEATV